MINRTLGDIAAELEGLEDVIALVGMLVSPTNKAINGSIPTQATIDGAFHSIGETLHHIRDEVNQWERIALNAQGRDAHESI